MQKGIPSYISAGEIIDKITILEIKKKNITDPDKQINIKTELDILNKSKKTCLKSSAELIKLKNKLKKINQSLWKIEDDIRECERQEDFGSTFIKLARAVYFTNDQRATTKNEINKLVGSGIIEVKSYAKY